MTFCVIEKIHEINLYLFNCNSYFSKKKCKQWLKLAVETTGSQLQDFFVQKELPLLINKIITLEQKLIIKESLTWQGSRDFYKLKIWFTVLVWENIYCSFENLKSSEVFAKKVLTKSRKKSAY